MQWVKCFLKYISLMMVQRIQETPAMVSYMHTIIRAAETNPGLSWLFYDKQFRLKLVTHPDMEWGTIDNHLWVYCITNFQENKPIEIETPGAKRATKPHAQAPFQRGRGGHFRPAGRERGSGGVASYSQSQTSQQSYTPREKTKFKGYDWYNKGVCTRRNCTWPHVCQGCGKSHTLSSCTEK
jgi:hypothetical protein